MRLGRFLQRQAAFADALRMGQGRVDDHQASWLLEAHGHSPGNGIAIRTMKGSSHSGGVYPLTITT